MLMPTNGIIYLHLTELVCTMGFVECTCSMEALGLLCLISFFTGFVCFCDVYLLTAHPRTGCDVEQYNKWDVNQPRTFVETDGTATLMVYFLIRESCTC